MQCLCSVLELLNEMHFHQLAAGWGFFSADIWDVGDFSASVVPEGPT